MNKNSLKWQSQTEVPILLTILVTLIISWWFYPQLPDQLPTHWNFAGEVDQWSPKSYALGTGIGFNLLLYILFIFLPAFDPKSDNFLKFKNAYNSFRLAFHLFAAGLQIIVILAGLGFDINVGMMVKFGVGILFVVIGNYMPQFRPNYLAGIRTPWTLANDKVWQQTHRFAGQTWLAGGLLATFLAFVDQPWSPIVFLLAILGPALVSVVYSYLCFKKMTPK